MPNAQTRETSRRELLESISPSYRPWLHLSATIGSGLAVLALALVFIESPTAAELALIPIMFVVSNAGEWRAHKVLLHRRTPPAQILYDRHTPQHHVVYQYDDMALRDWRELKLILIPAFGVALIALSSAPIAIAVGLVWSANAGWLVLVSSALYMVLYELSHLSYHLPPESFVGRRAIVRRLREHHRRHHHPRLMQRWNFNVTLPLFDLVHGTYASRELVERTVVRPQAVDEDEAADRQLATAHRR